MTCVELCGGVYIAQRQGLVPIFIGCCTHLIDIRISLGIGLGVGQCE